MVSANAGITTKIQQMGRELLIHLGECGIFNPKLVFETDTSFVSNTGTAVGLTDSELFQLLVEERAEFADLVNRLHITHY